ncbi:MAG: protease inhibitor I42 family protein [Kiritimatiellae bacterium]|nr:protease inhibitor I42 family protein [Kiritimatiellia bacterium]
MKTKWKHSTDIVVLLILLTASTLRAEPLTFADNDKTLQLEPNEELTIELQGNPTTGYGWFVQTCDEKRLHQDGEAEYRPDSNLLGSGGCYTFTFRAVTPGETILTLVYHRPWEKDTPPLKTFSLHLQIRAGE